GRPPTEMQTKAGSLVAPCLLGLLLFLAGQARAALIAAPRGEMLENKGLVYYTHPPRAPDRAGRGQGLELNDQLSVEDKSWAIVRFLNLSQIRVRELSLIEVVEPETAERRYSFKLLKGQVYYSGLTKSTNMEVLTAYAKIDPNGTDFL